MSSVRAYIYIYIYGLDEFRPAQFVYVAYVHRIRVWLNRNELE